MSRLIAGNLDGDFIESPESPLAPPPRAKALPWLLTSADGCTIAYTLSAGLLEGEPLPGLATATREALPFIAEGRTIHLFMGPVLPGLPRFSESLELSTVLAEAAAHPRTRLIIRGRELVGWARMLDKHGLPVRLEER